MDERVTLGILAVFVGVLVGLVLFVPFVAISFRRRGGLGFWRLVGWAGFLVYFFAIWVYTLLPLPDPDALSCVGAILDPRTVVEDIRVGLAAGGNPLTSPQILQLVFNVLLFIPLGFFVRVLLGRGFLVTVAIGFGVSLFIETTQLTGVWGVYPCAYRFFDVGDLLTNTTGALVGAVLSLVVPKRYWGVRRHPDAASPKPVTRSRRLLAMLCDVVAALVVSAAAGIGTQLWLEYVAGDRAAVLEGTAGAVASTAAPLTLFAVVVFATGRSIGDLTVELRYAGGPMPEPAARIMRFAGGMGGYLLIGQIPVIGAGIAPGFAAVALVLVFTTERGRGLPGLLMRRPLIDARERREDTR